MFPKLAALKKAAAKASSALPGAPGAPTRKAGRAGSVASEAASAASDSGGVSSSKIAQLNATVDEARSMARQAMRTSNPQNKQLAKNYDAYLKGLKASIPGVQSDRDADRLIKQAGQTRAYIQFLLRQPQ